MTDTQLLNHIRQEMKRQGVVWKKEQELFEMLIPSEEWKKYKTSWSNWKQKRVHDLTKSPHIRLAIQQKLFFDSNIWGASSLVQKEAVKRGVYRAFVEKPTLLSDWRKIIPTFQLDSEQKSILELLEPLSVTQIEEKLEATPHYFERSFSNQAFLLALLKMMYAKGAYAFLGEKGVSQKMGYMLESQAPTVALVERTKRQMVEFVAMVERVGAKLPELVGEFKRVIEVLNDYENFELKSGSSVHFFVE